MRTVQKKERKPIVKVIMKRLKMMKKKKKLIMESKS